MFGDSGGPGLIIGTEGAFLGAGFGRAGPTGSTEPANRGARCFAPSRREILDHPRVLTNHCEGTSKLTTSTAHPRTKKGAGASPLFLRTDPPKPESQSRLGIRPPREANLL